MNQRFFHYLKIVAAVHVVLAVVAIAVSGWRGCVIKKKEEVRLPIEFVVQAPAAPAQPAVKVTVPPVKPPPVKPPEPIKPPEQPTKPKPPRKRINVSDKVVTRPLGAPPEKPLSDKEIKELLAKGAKLGDITSIPDDEQRCLARIHDVLYRAWTDRPNAVDVGDVVSKVRFDLTVNGGVKSRAMIEGSGNPAMDGSAMKAANAITQITGLSAAFLERHGYSITVSFRLELP